MTKKRKSKSTAKPLGPMATRFAVHLDCGLHEFGECFEDYAPSFVSHEDYGKGLLFFNPMKKRVRRRKCMYPTMY